jgi:hypothetical protein
MAITNAQQYQQLVNKPANGKRPGYRGDAAYRSASEQSSKSVGGQGNVGSKASFGGGKGTDSSGKSEGADGIDTSQYTTPTQDKNNAQAIAFAQSIAADKKRTEKRKRRLEEAALNKKNLFNKLGFVQRTKDANLEDLDAIDSQGLTIGGIKVPSFITGAANAFTIDPSTKYFDEDSIREIGGVLSKSKTGITGTQADTLADLRQDIQMEDRVLDPNDTVTQSEFTDYMNRNKVELPDNDGDGQVMDPCKGPNPPAYCFVGNDTEEDATPTRNLGGLAPRFAGSIFDFTGLADGGRAGMMDGGMMEDTPEGGIMDLESGRQMYFLGKLVKKATRAVKKVAKSPFGKAALGAALFKFGGGFGGGKGLDSFFGKGSFNPFLRKVAGDTAFSGLGNIASKFGMIDSKGAMTLGGKLGLGFGVPFALDALGVGKKEEEDNGLDDYYKQNNIDIAGIRSNPFKFMAPRFSGSQYQMAADGGRMGYAEGSKEPVAKETMPLLDMDNQEMDLREDGGFVPIGRMERADDVPARLSKNEFVFTADAVRNAGEGDIDKGAEVMYNMMKNLESGGEVSEESQGLDGAREMFQTSQRLEEVL